MPPNNNLDLAPELSIEAEDQLYLSPYTEIAQAPEIAVTRLTQVMTGLCSYSLFNWLYDYFFYTFVLWKFGILLGGIIIVSLSFVLDFSTLKLYDWSKSDWLALEYIKSLKQYKGKNIFKRFLSFIFNSTPLVVQLAVLSTKFNAFVVTTLLREGAYEYQGLSRRDYAIFILSNLIGHLYWIAILGLGIEATQEFLV